MPPEEIVVVHTSDVHVDHEYNARRFGGDGVGPLRAVLETANDARADLLLLVGDTFESNRVPESLVVATARALDAFGRQVVILPGNHDPVVDGGVYAHPAMSRLPNVAILGATHGEAVIFDQFDLEVWGRAHRHYGDMDPLVSPPPRLARWRIALAHGHYEERPDRSTRARPSWLCGAEEITATRADYVAFGHWNRAVRVGACAIPAFYSGSPDYAGTVNVVRLGPQGVAVERAPVALPPEVMAQTQGF
ncbi:MAG: exonuclease SbcCD subunit D [Beijerinckiaceae bacterium]